MISFKDFGKNTIFTMEGSELIEELLVTEEGDENGTNKKRDVQECREEDPEGKIPRTA